MNRKPWIGITPLYDPDLQNSWMLDEYTRGIEAAGGIPLILSPGTRAEDLEQLLELLDGLLLPGGQDLEPQLYGQEAHPAAGVQCPWLDELEVMLLRAAVQRRIPLLGICRGHQLINAAFGGTLYQDLPSQMDAEPVIVHNQGRRVRRDYPVHSVSLELDSKLGRALGRDLLRVNSLHHQGIRELAPGLRAAALAPDGLAECVEGTGNGFVLGVQWHPELMFHRDDAALAVFRLFVEAAENYRGHSK